MIYVPGKGPRNPKIIIVGESPSYDEEKTLTPFTGPSGRFLNALLHEAGIDRNACWVTNVVKYFVPFGDSEKLKFSTRCANHGIDFNQQVNDLYSEISALSPNVIIALGSTALYALTGKSPIQKWRGSIINAFGFKCIPTYHPAHILHQEGEVKGYWNRPVMVFDLKRAKAQSEFREFRLPHRTLHVANSSYELENFIERYKHAKNPAIDIEAKKCIPVCVGISFTPSEGITVPLWNDDGPRTWYVLHKFLSIQDVVGQNFGYDRDKLRRLGFTIRSLYSDTMLKSFCINPELPKNLAFNTSIYTEEPYYKDEGMYEGSDEDLFLGCARDACVTKEIDIAQEKDIEELGQGSYYRNFLLPLHEVYFYNEQLDAIEQNGFAVDEEIRRNLISKYIGWDERIRYELYKLTGSYINSSSPKQVTELLYETLLIPRRQGTGEEVLTQLLNNVVKDEKQRRIIELILEDRRVKKTVSSYLMSPSDFDGRMRTSYYICLETGRSATAQQEPPIRPSVEYKEGSVKKKQSRGMAFQTITKHGDIGNDVRTMLVADKGYVLLQADSRQAEARVVQLLANDYDPVEYDRHDQHAVAASWFFGGTEEQYSKKVLGYECPERFGGKTLRHAGNLGASKKRAAIELNTQARKYKVKFQISEYLAGKALEIFHKKCPNIRGVFHQEVIECIKSTRRLYAPVPYDCDVEVGGTRMFFERDGEDLYRMAFALIPQRSISENTKGAIRRTYKRMWRENKVLVESHDAMLVLARIESAIETAEIMREEMERPIDFSRCSLPRGIITIPCDVEIGLNYHDMTKFKGVIPDELVERNSLPA